MIVCSPQLRCRDKLIETMTTKKELLTTPVKHIDITQHNVVALVDAMASMAYTSRDTARAASIREELSRTSLRSCRR